jgi:hypothetical protein
MQHDLLFLKENAHIPHNVVTSTARKGRKWFDQAKVGDVLMFRTTEDKALFGAGVVVRRELVRWSELLDRHQENHDGRGRQPLERALRAAYGDGCENDYWTMLFFVRLTSPDEDCMA